MVDSLVGAELSWSTDIGNEVFEACVADVEVCTVVCAVEVGVREDGVDVGDEVAEEPAQHTSINNSY